MAKQGTATSNGKVDGRGVPHQATRSITTSVVEKVEVTESAAEERPPDERRRRLTGVTALIGCWQVVLAVATVAAAFAAWPVVAGATSTVPAPVRWFGPDFRITTTSGALLLGMIGGVAGSLVHTITIFSSRVGRDTLEASYLWWYLLRPFAAALLALLFVAAVHSGLVSIGGGTRDPSPVVVLIAGGLAGLFTDAVLQRLRRLLGATSTEAPASKQDLPLAAPPTSHEPGAQQ